MTTHDPIISDPTDDGRPRRTTLRYTVLGVVLIALGAAVGSSVYALTSVPFRASCLFRIAPPLTDQTGSDYFAVGQYLARSEIAIADETGAYADAQRVPGVDPRAIARASVVEPTGVLDYTSVTISSASSSTASTSANALCQALVDRISAARASLRDSERADLARRVVDLQDQARSITGSGSTSVSDQVTLAGVQTAVTAAQQTMAALLSRPPEQVVVTAKAATGYRIDQRNLAGNLLVGGAVGLLTTFLLILLIESAGVSPTSVTDRHRRDTADG